MIEIVFPKESRYVEFFDNVKDVDGNLVLTPYYEIDYKGEKREVWDTFAYRLKMLSTMSLR